MAVVINLNFGKRSMSVPIAESMDAEPEVIRYLIYEGLTPLDIFQYRAAAKGKGKTGKQCKTGQACGNTCISKTKTCKNGLSGATKEKAKNAKAKTAAKSKSKPATPQNNESAIPPELKTEHQRNLYLVATGGADSRDPDVIRRQDKELEKDNNSKYYQYDKIDRLMEEGLTEIEAHGVAAWIDNNYEPINRAIYAPEMLKSDADRDYAEGTGIRALQGLQKLPPYKHEDLKKAADGEELLEEGRLRRGITVSSDNLANVLKPYQDAIGKPEYLEPTFFATSGNKTIDFVKSANVVIEVKSKSDGTGQGRAIDKFKGDLFEGEVLYPPFSKFKVTEIKESKGESNQSQFIVYMEEL
jgi:hypothetical protein